MLSRLDRAYSNIAATEALERYWSVASLHDECRPSDHLPLVVRGLRPGAREWRG